MTWGEVTKHFDRKTSEACRLRYRNHLEKRPWTKERKESLGMLYHQCVAEPSRQVYTLILLPARYRQKLWAGIADKLGEPWQAVEAEHWKLSVKYQVDIGQDPEPDRLFTLV